MDVIVQVREQSLRSIEMFVSFDKSADGREKHPKIVFNTCLIASVTGLLKMDGSCRILDHGTVSIIGAVFGDGEKMF